MAAVDGWKKLKGVLRVQAEFKHMAATMGSSSSSSRDGHSYIKELSVVGDNICVWQLKLRDFDADIPGGRQLNQDLARLQQLHGQDHILLQIEFPEDYPTHPFFVRVVTPRCVMYTGHVTAGGAICLEALTCSGTPGSWQPDFSVEGLMNVIMINMIDCPVMRVQTLTGPGGTSGPLRIDFSSGNPCMPYSSDQALAAFNRTLRNHMRLGWEGPHPLPPAPQPQAPPVPAAANGGAGAIAGTSGLAGSTSSAHVWWPNDPAAAAAAGRAGGGRGPSPAAAAAAHRQSSSRQPHQQRQLCVLHGPRTPPLRSEDSLLLLLSPQSQPPADQQAVLVTAAGIQRFKAAYARYLLRKRQMETAGAAGEGQEEQQRLEDSDLQQDMYTTQLLLDVQMESDLEGQDEDGAAAAAAAAGHDGQAAPAGSERGTAPSRKRPRADLAAADDDAGGYNHGEGEEEQEQEEDAEARQRQRESTRRRLALGLRVHVGAAGKYAADQEQQQQHQQQEEDGQDDEDEGEGEDGYDDAWGVGDGAAAAAAAVVDLALPSHWDLAAEADGQDGAVLVNIGVPEDLTPMLESAAAATHALADAALDSLTRQGLQRLDALAALLLEGGLQEHAMLRAFVYAGQHGKCVEIWRDRCLEKGMLSQAELTLLQQHREVDKILQQLVSSSDGRITRDNVIAVERVQNPALWRRYVARREDIRAESGDADLNERLLFHGTSCSAAESIVRTGFDKAYSKDYASFGKGVYFADHSSTSLRYCSQAVRPGEQQQHKKMIVARVALGRQTTGGCGVNRVPKGFDSFNSGISRMANGAYTRPGEVYCHVVCDNSQAYPEYVITLH